MKNGRGRAEELEMARPGGDSVTRGGAAASQASNRPGAGDSGLRAALSPSSRQEQLRQVLESCSAEVEAWPPWKRSPDVVARLRALGLAFALLLALALPASAQEKYDCCEKSSPYYGSIACACHVAPEEPPTTTSVLAGPAAGLSDESGAFPTLRVTVDAPAVLGESEQAKAVGRITVSLALAGLPGEDALDATNPATFRTAELGLVAKRRIGVGFGGATYLVGKYGFATRFGGDAKPRDRYARHFGGGIEAEHRDKGVVTRWIRVLYGRAEPGAPEFGKGQWIFEGEVALATVKGVGVVLGGDAYLGVGRSQTPGARDVMRIYVATKWGRA